MRRKSHWSKYELAPKDQSSLMMATSDSDSDEIHLSDEDMELLNEYGHLSSFLTQIKPDELTKNKYQKLDVPWRKADSIQKKQESDSEEEADYELKPRKNSSQWKEEDSASRLPIKLEDGRMELPKSIPQSKIKDDIDLEEALDKEEVQKTEEVTKKVSTISAPKDVVKQKTKKSTIQIQEELGSLAAGIIEDPEHHLNDLTQLRTFASHKNCHIRRLALLAQLAVFKDIIPGYRIRKRTEKEDKVKLSKDVEKVKKYEESLLSHYQQYLQNLEATIKESSQNQSKSDDSRSLFIVAIQCMADLLKTVPHFNFRTNLVTAVVSYMHVTSPPEISIMCCNAMKVLFQDDESGEVSLEAVKLMSKMIKSRGYRVPPQVIETFLHLRLREELVKTDEERGIKLQNKKRKKDKEAHVSRKARKVMKVSSELEAELKEAEATYDKEEKEKMQTETLKFIFVTYFRILKNASKSTLLSPVLEGLAKFAHLINVDFFHDLLNVLKQISLDQYQNYLDANGNHSSETKNALHCVIAAFQLLSGQGEALNIDLKDFYSSLYTQMMRIPLSTGSCVVEQDLASPVGEMNHMAVLRHSDIHILLQGFELVFYRKKQLPIQRVAAFAKRLATISLQLAPNALLACLAMIRSLLIRFPKLDILFDVESRMGTGVYMLYLDDPELANANATNIWEISQLAKHYHPRVREFAKHILEMSTEKYQSGTRRGVDPNLTLRSVDYLEKYETIKDNRFRINPPAQVPGVVKQFVKRKNKSGFKRIDGPTFLIESDFISKLYREIEL